jgi:DNA-binding MarR family transcriptional regulator
MFFARNIFTFRDSQGKRSKKIFIMESTARKIRVEEDLAAELLEFFYPIHYQGEMALEDALRGGVLTRKQAAILWLIRSEGEQGRSMRRKDVERLMQNWFEVSSSAITKAIRGMARPPLSLVQVVEDPHSGREKQVFLTPKGERFLLNMVARGQQFLQKIVEQLPQELVKTGIEFLSQATAAFERVRAATVAHDGKGR